MTPTKSWSGENTARPAPGEAAAEDRALLARVGAGDEAAFTALVARHGPTVERLTRRLLLPPAAAQDVDDVVQDVFARVWERASGFRNASEVATWITAVTLNACRSRRRREWVRRLTLRRFAETQNGAAPAADHAAVRDEAAERVRDAMQSLRPADREIIVLHHLEGQTAAEVAGALGVSVAAAELRLHRARARLRSLLDPDPNRTDGP